MDLTSVLLRAAARRPRVLVVPAAGGAAVRMAVEASITRRGWPTATGPADADIIAVTGSPGPELGAVIERVWRQVPAPRAYAAVAEPSDVDRELDGAARVMADRHHQRSHAPGGAAPAVGAAGHDGHGGGSLRPDDVDVVQPGHGDTGHDESSGPGGHPSRHGPHGHHGHGAGTELPGGLPMADLGEDRDGLTLDRLHVPLGPVLPDWPAGLVARVTLQGDVIQEAAVELLDAGPGSPSAWWTGRGATRELDGLGRFLGVTGWADAAAQSRRLRDALLAGGPPDRISAPAAALVRRVRRSRTLRWLVRGIQAGATDVAGLLEQRLAAIEAAVASGADGVGAAQPAPRLTVDGLAGLLVGAELGAARVIVAAVDPDTERTPALEGPRHG